MLKLSSKKRIPLLVHFGREYYPWQLFKLLEVWSGCREISKQAESLGLEFSNERWRMIADEWDLWKRCYTPSITSLSKDSLILDAGAGEGETVLFYYLLGFRNFHCVELDSTAFRTLKANVANFSGARFDLQNRKFQAEDVQGVEFAKIDVEGGEVELLHADLSSIREIVLETHGIEIERCLRGRLPEMTHQLNWSDSIKMWRWVKKNALMQHP
jgi:hypothetical protein